MVLLVGGIITFASGAVALWGLREVLLDLISGTDRPAVEGVTAAFRSYRKAARGVDPEETAEIDAVVIDRDGDDAEEGRL